MMPVPVKLQNGGRRACRRGLPPTYNNIFNLLVLLYALPEKLGEA